MMLRYACFLYWVLGIGFWVAFSRPDFRRLIFYPTGRFSGHGKFFNRFCMDGSRMSPPSSLVLPIWAERVYGLFISPQHLFHHNFKSNCGRPT